jgi:GGDEF domain-containing protein
VLAASDAHLLLAGPDANQVADDPEARAVLAEVRERWRRLPPPARARVHLACLPLTSPDVNAAMVNAIQRQAAVVVKKSLQEGFGLGVTEAMWKARPVVASAVGGHLDQVQHLHSGLLVEDPADVGAFGDAIVELLREPPLADRLGQTARERARALFLNDRHFMRWVDVLGSALQQRAGATRSEGPAAGVPERAPHGAGALDLADRDHLTGLWNRRRFEQELDRSRQKGERRRRAPRRDASARPEPRRRALHGRARAVPHRRSSHVHATISIGGAFLDAGTQTHHEALLAADTALYEAKVAGGDRAILHESLQGARTRK